MRSTNWLTASMAVMFWMQLLPGGTQDGPRTTLPESWTAWFPSAAAHSQSEWDQRRQLGRFVGGQPILFLDDELKLGEEGLTGYWSGGVLSGASSPIRKDEKPVLISLGACRTFGVSLCFQQQ